MKLLATIESSATIIKILKIKSLLSFGFAIEFMTVRLKARNPAWKVFITKFQHNLLRILSKTLRHGLRQHLQQPNTVIETKVTEKANAKIPRF